MSVRGFFVGVVAVSLLSGCGSKDPSGGSTDAGADALSTADGGASDAGAGSAAKPDAGVGDPLTIVTESLGVATVGTAYTQPLAASGGVPPFAWVLSSKASGLGWLSIGSASGLLSGVPNAIAVDGLELTASVTDAQSLVARKTFTLKVVACSDGAVVTCTASSGQACYVGSQTCTNGQLPTSCSGTPSTDVKHCGVTCGLCAEGLTDRCTNGLCACGAGAACVVGEACCGGQCKRLDDAKTCGACDNNCVALAGANVTATCAVGQCAFACSSAGYQHCEGSSAKPVTAGVAYETNTSSDPKNCGDCGHDCSTTSATVVSFSCQASQCALVCTAGHLDCDGAPQNGCETPFSTSNCGQCGHACVAGAHQLNTTCQADGTCAFECEAGWADCDKNPSNGCEANIWQASSCGTTCAGRVACSSDKRCNQGQCVCQNETAACSTGTACGTTSGRCECTTSSCSGGCCTAQGVGGQCMDGTQEFFCGRNGAVCGTCSGSCTGSYCTSKSKTGVCNTTSGTMTCASGACQCSVTEECTSTPDCRNL